MSNSIGKSFQVSIFGESHNKIIGVTIANIAPGLKLDFESIKNNLRQRRPKRASETLRVEHDEFEVVSGFFNDATTGTPLTILIYNSDIKSSDYEQISKVYRPSHADYGAHIKYLGYEDYRGGGHFSGRLTAPLVIAGSIAQQILTNNNIVIKTHIKQVKHLSDESFTLENIEEQIAKIDNNELSVIDENFQKAVLKLISEVSRDKDSVGARLESVILNVQPGLGEPFFNKLDSSIANYLMAIPAIKGVSFGDGFDFANALGSEVIDEYYFDEKIKTLSNHNGGIIGGISTGMPIIVNSVIKPASSIGLPLKTVSKKDNQKQILEITGRHDSSIFTRVSIVVDSLLALAIIDAYCVRYGYMWQKGEVNNV